MSVQEDLVTGLCRWARWALDTNGFLAVPVIRTNQQAARPVGTYIAIEDHLNMTPFGYASRGTGIYEVDTDVPGEAPEDPPTKVTTTHLASVTDYQCRVSMWEVSGNGDALRVILQVTDWQASRDFLGSYKIACMRGGEIVHMPRLQGEAKWTEEFRIEFTFGVATDLPEPLGYIGTVELTNNIGEP